MQMKIFAYLIILTVGLMGGCSYKSIRHGEEISQSSAAQIERGRTTKEDIFLEFGEPTKTAENDSVFFYTWTRGKRSSFFGIGSGNADANSLVVIFDDDGVVKDYRISRGAVDSGQID